MKLGIIINWSGAETGRFLLSIIEMFKRILGSIFMAVNGRMPDREISSRELSDPVRLDEQKADASQRTIRRTRSINHTHQVFFFWIPLYYLRIYQFLYFTVSIWPGHSRLSVSFGRQNLRESDFRQEFQRAERPPVAYYFLTSGHLVIVNQIDNNVFNHQFVTWPRKWPLLPLTYRCNPTRAAARANLIHQASHRL